MTPKLSVVVHIDVDGRHTRIAVTGRLTATNQQGLHPVVDHARALTPEVTVDLTATDGPAPHAVAQLRQALDDTVGPPRPITVLAPVASSARDHPRPGEPLPTLAPTREACPAPAPGAPHCSKLTAPRNTETTAHQPSSHRTARKISLHGRARAAAGPVVPPEGRIGHPCGDPSPRPAFSACLDEQNTALGDLYLPPRQQRTVEPAVPHAVTRPAQVRPPVHLRRRHRGERDVRHFCE